ncbi:MAG TPA: hypothetical protein VEW07_12695 [Solirubrobacterales bacterium]|nr:hypothetical protein [Solirubrobacterales bacterium]
MGNHSKLGDEAVCLLLHNLVPGGSARQWVNLLGDHVQHGGRATIVAPWGPLGETAEDAGIKVVHHGWHERTPHGCDGVWPILAEHDVAVVHWDHRVMHAFEPALATCGRAALTVHQAPQALSRWFGPEAVTSARVPLEQAVSARRATVLVRGEWHRERIASAFDLPESQLRLLPASIPLPSAPAHPASAEPAEVLALTRLSAEKAAIVQLAAELVRARLDSGQECHLTIAGDGPWRDGALALCESRLPARSWRLEPAPTDPLNRLAAADLVVTQGLTTLEAAALERRVVVARPLDDNRAAGVVLSPAGYDAAAGDPFGRPPLSDDPRQLWREILALNNRDLRRLRRLVARRNSLTETSSALSAALRSTLQPAGKGSRPACQGPGG